MIDSQVVEDSEDPYTNQPSPLPSPPTIAPWKRGHPVKKSQYDSIDNEIFTLLGLWSTKEELFNITSPLRYHNRDYRIKVLQAL